MKRLFVKLTKVSAANKFLFQGNIRLFRKQPTIQHLHICQLIIWLIFSHPQNLRKETL